MIKGHRHKGHLLKQFPLIFLRTLYHRAFISHLLIGLGKDMTLFEFELIRSKVKVTFDQLCKQFLLNIYKTID